MIFYTALASGTFDTHRYEVFNIPEGWEAAINAANMNSGYLVTITSEAENNFVFQLVSKFNTYALLGATVNSTATGYEWLTGEPFTCRFIKLGRLVRYAQYILCI